MAMLSIMSLGFSQITAVGTVSNKASVKSALEAGSSRNLNAPVATLTHCPNDGAAGNATLGNYDLTDLTVISYFPASVMGNYSGNVINKIGIGVHPADLSGDLIVKIWTDTTDFGATTAYEQTIPVANLVDGWNDIVLTTPFAIDGSTLSFGYTCHAPAGSGVGYDNTAYAADSLGSTLTIPSYAYRSMLKAGADLYLSASVKAYVDDGANFVDAEITNLSIPNWNCDLSASETCTATVKNNGTAATGDFTLGYTVNTDPEVQVNITSIDPGMTANIDFNVDMSTDGSVFSIKAYTQLANDEVPGDPTTPNDTLTEVTINTTPSILPMDVAFDFTTYDFAGMNAEDVNNDDSKWVFANYTANGLAAHSGDYGLIYVFNGTNAADDYMYSNCIDLEAGHYTLTFWSKVGDNGATPPVAIPEKLSVKIGMGQEFSAMTQTITDLGEISNMEWEQTTVNFEITTTGIYNLGFYAYSDADMYLLMVDDIHLEVDIDASINDIKDNALNIYPNPTTGLVNIVNAKNATINVYNQVGALVMSVENTNNVDLSSFENGTYIVKVITKENTSVKKVVLTK